LAKVPDNDFFLFLDKQKMTSQYSRSTGSWRTSRQATCDYCAV